MGLAAVLQAEHRALPQWTVQREAQQGLAPQVIDFTRAGLTSQTLEGSVCGELDQGAQGNIPCYWGSIMSLLLFRDGRALPTSLLLLLYSPISVLEYEQERVWADSCPGVMESVHCWVVQYQHSTSQP